MLDNFVDEWVGYNFLSSDLVLLVVLCEVVFQVVELLGCYGVEFGSVEMVEFVCDVNCYGFVL